MPSRSRDALASLVALADLATPHAVRAAVNLELPSLVAEGATSLDDLVRRTGSNPRALKSLVRFLTIKGVFAKPKPGVLGLTDVGRLLTTERARIMLKEGEASDHLNQAWCALTQAVKTGAAGYPAVFGSSLWDKLAKVLIVERLVQEPASEAHLRTELFMLLLFGSGERTLGEFIALATPAGLAITGTRGIGPDLSIIECSPRAVA